MKLLRSITFLLAPVADTMVSAVLDSIYLESDSIVPVPAPATVLLVPLAVIPGLIVRAELPMGRSDFLSNALSLGAHESVRSLIHLTRHLRR